MAAAVFGFFIPGLFAAAQTEVDESWPHEESDRDVSQVNEGQLRFIAPPEEQAVLHSDTQLWLTPASLQNGWVEMRQCYRNLDAVGKTEVVYAYREMRELEVLRAENIARYRVKPRGVELEDVKKGALLCLQARVRILQRLSNNIYGMRHGPYHRKFLDGYYPYHLSLTVSYPGESIRLHRIEPEAQHGFDVKDAPASLAIETWFEGELRIDLQFVEN